MLKCFSKRQCNFQYLEDIKKSGQMMLIIFPGGYQWIRYLLAFNRSSLFLLFSIGLTLALLLNLNNLLFFFIFLIFFFFFLLLLLLFLFLFLPSSLFSLDSLYHTLISSGDHCSMAYNLCLTASRYLTPIVR